MFQTSEVAQLRTILPDDHTWCEVISAKEKGCFNSILGSSIKKVDTSCHPNILLDTNRVGLV